MSRKGPRELFTGREGGIGERIKGRHSFKVNAPIEAQQKQLRAAEEKRSRKGAARIEASTRGQIAQSPSLSHLLFIGEEIREELARAEQETIHQGPDQ